jgi:hypothetical protein
MPKLQFINIIALGSIAIAALIAIVLLYFVKKHRVGVNIKWIIFYAIGMVVLNGLLYWVELVLEIDPFKIFVSLQILNLIVGTIHVVVMYKKLKWVRPNAFWMEFFYTLAIGISGFIGYASIGKFLKADYYSMLFSSSLIVFIIPFLVYQTFLAYIGIPYLKYKLWYYPVGFDIPDPMQYDLSEHMKVIAFEFEPTEGATMMNIKLKAPERMELGHYFMSFIEQYNLRNPETPFAYIDEFGEPNGWIFKLKQSWYKSEVVFDPEMTINDNDIERVYY